MNPAVIVGTCITAVLQCALVALVVEIVMCKTPHVAAARRHRAWLATLAITALLPGLDLLARTQASSGDPLAARALAAFSLPPQAAAAALCVWLAATSVFVLRLGLSMLRLRLLLRRSAPIDGDVELRARTHAVALGIRARIDVRSCAEIHSPIAIGLCAPAILIPEGLRKRLTAEQLDDVLLHELAHLQRHDGAVNLAARLARALLCWNPVIAVIERRIALERELACDETVVAMTGRRERYARTLAAVILWGPAPAGASAFARSSAQSVRRIERLIAGPAVTRTSRRPLVAVLGAASLAALAVAVAPKLVAFDVSVPGQQREVPIPAALALPAAFAPEASPVPAGFAAESHPFAPRF